jgi:bacterial/archaeal transporter family protein
MDWRVLILLTVLSWGGYNVLLKWAGDQLAWQASMLLFVVAYALVVGVYSIVYGHLSLAHVMGKQAAAPLLAGVLCALGAITFFKAIPMASGSVLMPLVGLYPIVTAIGCIVLLREPVSLRLGIGMLCAGAAVVLLGR